MRKVALLLALTMLLLCCMVSCVENNTGTDGNGTTEESATTAEGTENTAAPADESEVTEPSTDRWTERF